MWIYCIPHTDMIPSMKTSSLILGIASFCVNTSVMSPKTMKRIGKIAPVIIANTLWTLISPKVIISIQDTKNTKSYHLNNIFFVELTYLRGNQADLITCSPMHTSYWRKNWPKTVYVEKNDKYEVCAHHAEKEEKRVSFVTKLVQLGHPNLSITLSSKRQKELAQPNLSISTTHLQKDKARPTTSSSLSSPSSISDIEDGEDNEDDVVGLCRIQHHQLSDNRHYCADSTNVIFLQLRRVSRPSSPSPCGHQHPQCRIALQTRTRPEHLIFSWELPLSGCMYGEPNCFSGMKIANKSRTYKTAIVCDEECYIVKLLLLQGGHPAWAWECVERLTRPSPRSSLHAADYFLSVLLN